MVGLATGVTHS